MARCPGVVWMDFGKELPCEYISPSFEWSDTLEVKMVAQLKVQIGLDLLNSHLLKRPSGLNFA